MKWHALDFSDLLSNNTWKTFLHEIPLTSTLFYNGGHVWYFPLSIDLFRKKYLSCNQFNSNIHENCSITFLVIFKPQVTFIDWRSFAVLTLKLFPPTFLFQSRCRCLWPLSRQVWYAPHTKCVKVSITCGVCRRLRTSNQFVKVCRLLVFYFHFDYIC